MKLKKYLAINEMKKEDLAKLCGVSPGTIYNVMNGKNVRWDYIQTIVRKTGGQVSYIDLETPQGQEDKKKKKYNR